MEWTTVLLGDVAEFTNGGAWKQSEYTATGIPVVRVSDFSGDSVDLSSCKFLPPTSGERYAKHRLGTRDLLIATVGSHPTQPASVVGRPVFVPPAASGALLNQNAVRISPKNNALDKSFLGYLGKSPGFRKYVIRHARGTANQVRIAIGALREMTVHLPPIGVQRRIAGILSAYDDLIENNTRRIAILEETTGAIYREWFLEFRFLGHEQVEMVDSELGPVPEGWTVGEFGQLAVLTKQRFDPTPHGTSPLLDLARIPRRSMLLADAGDPDELSTSRIVFDAGDILFGAIRPYFHKVVRPGFAGVTNTSVLVLKPTEDLVAEYAFQVAFADGTVDWASQHAGGTKMPVIKWDVLRTMPVLIPPANLLRRFTAVVRPMHEAIWVLTREIRVLRETRDLLLPKLISGEIHVSEAEQEMESAAA